LTVIRLAEQKQTSVIWSAIIYAQRECNFLKLIIASRRQDIIPFLKRPTYYVRLAENPSGF
jgi:hypothetical protein